MGPSDTKANWSMARLTSLSPVISPRLDAITINASTPILATNPVTNLAGTGATLNGTFNANGTQIQVIFEYGETVTYGTTVDVVPGAVAGSSDTGVNADITGPTQNTRDRPSTTGTYNRANPSHQNHPRPPSIRREGIGTQNRVIIPIPLFCYRIIDLILFS